MVMSNKSNVNIINNIILKSWNGIKNAFPIVLGSKNRNRKPHKMLREAKLLERKTAQTRRIAEEWSHENSNMKTNIHQEKLRTEKKQRCPNEK